MIAYAHINKHKRKYTQQEGTFVVDTPDKSYLETAFLTHSNTIQLSIGGSFLHPSDNFCRSTGRKQALQLIAPEYVKLHRIEVRGTRHVYHCTVDMPNRWNKKLKQSVDFGLCTVAESALVNLVYANYETPYEDN